MTATSSGRGGSRRLAGAVVAALALLTALAYRPLARNGFVMFDDQRYITENPRITQGFTADNLRWAFTTFEMGNWHPLTWLSLLLDGRLHGLDARGFHATSLLLHLATAALVFAVLRGLTGATWRSALVAGLFALHPQRVESVAWAAERKDVLAGFFWVLTTAAYLRYVRRPGRARLLAVAGGLALGLMSKALLVTLPFALLLLDFWPLGRFGAGARAGGPPSAAGRLLLEKAPLLALAAAASVLAYRAQHAVGAVAEVAQNTAAARAGTALHAYLLYLGKAFWPAGLAPLYPYHGTRVPALASLAALAAVTALAVAAARSRPWLVAGWLWFLGTLVPMIGLVQIGDQVIADRYTYVPHLGLAVALVWSAGEAVRRAPALRPPAAAASALLLLALAGATAAQVPHWRDSVALFSRVVAVGPGNFKATVLLGKELATAGRLEEANAQFLAALRMRPDFPDLNANVGLNLYRRGRREEAVAYLLEEARIQPANARAHEVLGQLYGELGRGDEAQRHQREARRLRERRAR